MMMELLFAVIGISVAGLAAVVGIWMERDPRRPPRWAWALSVLILMATGVTVFQSYLEVQQGDRMEEDMARMLQMIDKLAAESDDPNLKAFATSEINAQARANPDIVEKLTERIEEDGGDATAMLAKHMPASEVSKLAKKGKVKQKTAEEKKKKKDKDKKDKDKKDKDKKDKDKKDKDKKDKDKKDKDKKDKDKKDKDKKDEDEDGKKKKDKDGEGEIEGESTLGAEAAEADSDDGEDGKKKDKKKDKDGEDKDKKQDKDKKKGKDDKKKKKKAGGSVDLGF